MDPIEFPENLAELTDEARAELLQRANARLTELFAITEGDAARQPTQAEADETDALLAGIERIDAHNTAASAAADRFAANRERFASREEPPAESGEVAGPPGNGEGSESGQAPASTTAADGSGNSGEGAGATRTDQNAEGTSTTASAAPPNPAAAAGRRPAAPAEPSEADRLRGERQGALTLVASADMPNVAPGTEIDGLDQLADLAIRRWEGFPRPNGNGKGEDLRQFGLATFRKNIPQALMIDSRQEDPMEAIKRATDLHTLEVISGRSGAEALVAAGWCSPSEVTYNLEATESADGVYSLPEVGLTRAGLKHTLGPDWSDLFITDTFFDMTEAHAIAGDFTKPCITMTCPTWVDDRLDAVGLCIKTPFLLEAAYPELVRRFIAGFQVAHKIKRGLFQLNAVLAAVETTEGTFMDFTSITQNLFVALDILGRRERDKRALPENTVFEVLLPDWALAAIRNDIAFRNGIDNPMSITDQMILGEFTKRNFAPQFIRYWQQLTTTAAQSGTGATATGTHPAGALEFPPTMDFVFYRAGTFVSGTSDVVTLNSVYDAASLAGNVYTALFMEEGLNVMRMGYGGTRVTLPINVSGHTGSANASQAGHL